MTDRAGATDPWAWARESDSVDGVHDVSHAVVTAVVVAHDADRWLPPLLDSLAASTLRPHRVIAVDAGSSDGTANLLTEALSTGLVDVVNTAPSGASFGAAVAEALAGAGAVGSGAHEWLWLLHDDAVADPKSEVKQQPDYCRNATRSIKPNILIAVGICTHLGCSPTAVGAGSGGARPPRCRA